MKPLITVYITNHNYQKYISKSITSVLNQNFKNFELIIIDDGSTDNSIKEIEKFTKKNKEIIFIKQKKKGLVASNNIAINIARGKYIMRLDADDWLDTNALKIMYSAINKNKDIAMVFPDYYEVNSEGKIISKFIRHNFKKVNVKDQPAHGACSLIKLEILKKIGGYDQKFVCQDGFYIWMKLILKYKVFNINKPLFYYRRHGKSLTTDNKLINKTRSELLEKLNKKKKKKAVAVLAFRGSQINKDSLMMKKLGNKELIFHSIDSTLKAKKITKVIITSSDTTMLNYIKRKRKNKKLVFYKRSKSLSQFNISLIETLRDCSKFAFTKRIDFDYLYSINTNSPFISLEDINNAYNLISIFNFDKVIAVKKETADFYKHNGKGLQKISNDNFLRLERDEIYKSVGLLTLYNKNFFNIVKTGHIIADEFSSFGINNKLDFLLAKKILEHLSIKGRSF